jgi:hypothetical protein
MIGRCRQNPGEILEVEHIAGQTRQAGDRYVAIAVTMDAHMQLEAAGTVMKWSMLSLMGSPRIKKLTRA